MSEKLNRMALDDEGGFMTAEGRPSFPRQTLFWSCNLPRERCNCRDSEPKREIPVSKHRLIQWFLNPSAHSGSAQSAFHRNFAPVFVSVRLKVVVVSGTTPPA